MPILARRALRPRRRRRRRRRPGRLPGILGYKGPSLGEERGAGVEPLSALIESMMVRKRERDRAHRESARLVRARAPAAPGVHAAGRDRGGGEPARRARGDAATLEELGGRFATSRPRPTASRPATAARSASAVPGRTWSRNNIEFQPGDVLVTETGAPVWGYNAELESAMVIGPPTDEMRRLFNHMVAAQQVAFDALRPGVRCSDVDRAVMRYFEDNELLPYSRRARRPRIGLRNHEAPFLDLGDHTLVEPGWSSRSSRASTTPRSAASATRTRWP